MVLNEPSFLAGIEDLPAAVARPVPTTHRELNVLAAGKDRSRPLRQRMFVQASRTQRNPRFVVALSGVLLLRASVR